MSVASPRSAIAWLQHLDPRRSLAARALWLIVGLSVAFSISGALWVGRIARANILEQHARRLALETEELGSELGLAIGARLDAVRAIEHFAGAAPLQRIFAELRAAYPELDWIASAESGSDAGAPAWIGAGLKGPWLGIIAEARTDAHSDAVPAAVDVTGASSTALGDLAAPVHDAAGRVIGVVAAHLRWRRPPRPVERLTEESNPYGAAQAYVLDANGIVIVGPGAERNHPWSGVPDERPAPPSAGAGSASAYPGPHFERLPDGRRVFVARAPIDAGRGTSSDGWQILLSEPEARVYRRAHAVAFEVLWISLCLGAATVLLATLGARRLTARLQRLAASVAALGSDAGARLEIPGGTDEVAALGRAFADILEDLQRERRELQTLSSELERRVAVRTREVERLAEESRYAAVVRERLKMARDLHDTLAHSMMAMLSEIRFLRRLQAREPGSLADELARAEQIAHQGLREARTAIAQMRGNAVRDTGLGPTLQGEFERFRDRTGVAGECSADAEGGRFGDERAESLLRMAQEALRNVERHAKASRVSVELKCLDARRLVLKVADNGTGFDPAAVEAGHYGLVGLREQAELIGADLCIDSAPGRGTCVTITLPMSPVAFLQK